MLITEFATIQLRGGDVTMLAAMMAPMTQKTKMTAMMTITMKITTHFGFDSYLLQLSFSQHGGQGLVSGSAIMILFYTLLHVDDTGQDSYT